MDINTTHGTFRVHTSLTVELARFRSILGGVGGPEVSGVGVGIRGIETDDALSRVD